MNINHSNLILRWALGYQDTHKLKPYQEKQYQDMLWLTKMSICSFQRWFPDATFMLFYNGQRFDEFVETFDSVRPIANKEVVCIDQCAHFGNPYNFVPHGVWMKWVPMRFDATKAEISIDTDILCINYPRGIYEWLDGNIPILVPPERFSKILVNTCGDLHKHPVLQNKPPLNCGIVGHLAGYDYSSRFYEITKEVSYGHTHDSLFITEQGAINLWVYSLAVEGVDHFVLDFETNVWVRDLLYYMEKNRKVETVHATTWHKKIVKELKPVFERKIFDDDYNDKDFLKDLIANSADLGMSFKRVLRRQLEAL